MHVCLQQITIQRTCNSCGVCVVAGVDGYGGGEPDTPGPVVSDDGWRVTSEGRCHQSCTSTLPLGKVQVSHSLQHVFFTLYKFTGSLLVLCTPVIPLSYLYKQEKVQSWTETQSWTMMRMLFQSEYVLTLWRMCVRVYKNLSPFSEVRNVQHPMLDLESVKCFWMCQNLCNVLPP